MSISFDVASVLAAIILAGGGIFAYRSQKGTDREHALAMQRRELYLELLQAIRTCVVEQSDVAFNRASLAVMLIGSDEVVKALARFRINSNVSATSASPDLSLSELLIAMRRDVFKKTKLPAAELQEFLPLRRIQ